MAQADNDRQGSAQEPAAAETATPPVFTGGGVLEQREPRPLKPFLIAGAVLVVVLLILLIVGHRKPLASNADGTANAPVSAYASSLSITQIKMSDSTNLSGGKVTYLDGVLTNHGSRTVQGATAQVIFMDYANQLAARDTLAIDLIRTHEPYIDTEPVSASPIGPGQAREFRLIFDSVPEGWNGAYPSVRITGVTLR